MFAGASHAPGRIVAVASTPPNSDQNAQFAFSSFHPAGTNFLAADGSVKLVAETIDQATYLAVCTRASGDIVPNYCLNAESQLAARERAEDRTGNPADPQGSVHRSPACHSGSDHPNINRTA